MSSSIGRTLRLMQHPMVWMVGIYLGLIILLMFGIGCVLGAFTATQFGSILLLLLPLAVGGVLGMLRYDDYSPILFLMEGKKHYFGIVIPGIIIILAILITVILITMPISLIIGSIDQISLFGLYVGVSIPIFLLTLFYAPVIVSEGTTVTHSLLRSVALVSYDTISALKFWVMGIFTQFIFVFAISMAWAWLTYEHLEQYASLTIAEQQAIYSLFTMEEWMAMLGDGLFFLFLYVSVCVVVATTFLLCYLFVCYTDAKEAAPS